MSCQKSVFLNNFTRFSALLVVLLSGCASLTAQDTVPGSTTATDRSLKAGFEALNKNNYPDARKRFEDALSAFEKDKLASDWLFARIELPDEDPADASSPKPEIRQLTAFRHSMGTHQALLSFLAFTSQLAGDTIAADRYLDQIYQLQGPFWGSSWRVFAPLIQAVFHVSVPPEKTDNYGRYLFISGSLLWDAHEEKGQKLIEESQKLIPKDPQVAARLGSIYMIKQDPQRAKPQSELSLSIDPKQPHVLIDLSTAEWLLGSFDDSLKHAEAASALDSALPGPYLMLALIAIERNDLKKAENEISKAISLSNGHPFYLTVRALILESKGDSAGADKIVKDAWKNNPPPVKQFEAWYLKHKPLILLTQILSRQKTSHQD